MTLIIAYIHKNTVHLIADSVSSTTDSTEEREYNSFGEFSERTNEFKTKESLNKLYIFGETFAGGFAGEENEGVRILYDLKMYLRYFPQKKIRNILEDFFTNNEPKETEYLFGFTEDKCSYIFQYIDSGFKIIDSERTYVGIGDGIRNTEVQSSLETIDNCLQQPIDNTKEALVLSSSIIQNFVINNYDNFDSHFKKGYGGIVNGLLIDDIKVNESPDIGYVLYSNTFFNQGEIFIVQKFIRDNVIVINTAKDKYLKLYVSDLDNQFNYKKWLDKWAEDCLKRREKFDFEYLVFIAYDSRIISYIKKSNIRYNQLLETTNVGTENVGLNMSDSLLKTIIKSKEELNPLSEREGFPVLVNKL